MAIAALQIVTGGARSRPRPYPRLMLRTIKDGVLARVEGGDAETP